jgi:putative aldouronate transport system permease protein
MKINHRLRRELPLYLMILPPLLLLLVYNYGPMLGIVMAFQKFDPALGFFKSPWVGLYYFQRMLILPDVQRVVTNTLFIASLKIVFDTVAAILIAILLNELRNRHFKKTVQTIIYYPYFLSWVILGGIFKDFLASDGIVNKMLSVFGVAPIRFLSTASLFPWILVGTEVWQITGFGTILFLAAIVGISPTLYEAASLDGAGYFKRTWHVTLPGMRTTIVVMLLLSLGSILNAGFDQILNLYSTSVYSTGDVIDTWVYRAGIQQAQFSLAAAVGLFRSVVSLVLISLGYYFAYKKADYRVF